MKNILIFGGTTEGRILAEQAVKKNIRLTISVATDYGKELLPESENIAILKGRMKEDDIFNYIISNDIEIVIDATHPFATEATANISNAVKRTEAVLYRVVREKNISEEYSDLLYFDKMDDIVEYLNSHKGNVFFTTGSKELKYVERVCDYKSRVVIRILDVEKIVSKCISIGILKNRIIAKRGPFSYEENIRDFSRIDCKFLVTKESGNTGGYIQKIDAAMDLNMKVLVLKRPIEDGYLVDDIINMIL